MLDIEPATATISGKKYTLEPCYIESTSLGYEDHGIFTAYLHVSYGGVKQKIGGMIMDKPVERYSSERLGTAYGHDLIIRILDTVGVGGWEKLPGKNLYALKDERGHYYVAGIASWPSADKRLIFKEHAKKFYPEDDDSKG